MLLHNCAYQLTVYCWRVQPHSAIYFGDTTRLVALTTQPGPRGQALTITVRNNTSPESDMGNLALCWPNRINGDTVLQTAAGRPPCRASNVATRAIPASCKDLLVCCMTDTCDEPGFGAAQPFSAISPGQP